MRAVDDSTVDHVTRSLLTAWLGGSNKNRGSTADQTMCTSARATQFPSQTKGESFLIGRQRQLGQRMTKSKMPGAISVPGNLDTVPSASSTANALHQDVWARECRPADTHTARAITAV